MKNKNAFVADLAFLCMLLLVFICVLFLAGDPDNIWTNSVILTVACAVAVLTYFTNLTAGLVCNLVLVFAYVSYIIVKAVYTGESIPSYTYFWILWTPAMTAAVYLFTQRTTRLETENEHMLRQLTLLSGVDAQTELRNMQSFMRDAGVYMKISRRYDMKLMLFVWEFRFAREVEQLAGKGRMEELVKQVSDAITASLREEDAVYILDAAPHAWGTLLFTNPDSAHIVIERVESHIRQIDVQDISGKHDLYLDMRVGSAEYGEAVQSPLEFLELAKKQSEFDVS